MELNQTNSYRIIDLSVTLSESLPCTWPGHLSFAHKNWNWFSEVAQVPERTLSSGPYQTNFMIIDEHCGTHFDMPNHVIPPESSGLPHANRLGSISGECVSLADLVGPAVVIDVRFLSDRKGHPGKSPAITEEHIQAWETENKPIEKGEIVLFRTGWDQYYTAGMDAVKYVKGPLSQSFPGWPAPTPQTVLGLYERGVKTIGIDAPSIGAAHDAAPAHIEGLGRNLLYIELLANLGELPTQGASFIFLPLKVAGSSGSPGRAIAFIPR
jgi:isatin hydrolase